jgi:hypothetical protein
LYLVSVRRGLFSAGAQEFIADLASRLSHRVQLTSDGDRPYLEAVEAAFGADVDYAMLVNPAHISTSYVERQNWSVRPLMRRYTRLSNGLSRKIENHMAAVAINYFAYNFIKIHRTLRVTPAWKPGIVSRSV